MTDLNNILSGKSDYKHDKSNKKLDKNDNNDTVGKSVIGRIPKEVKYVKERKVVLDKLLNILGINDTNKVFFVDDLENDEAKQKQILDLVDDVKQYFSCGMWVYFAKKDISMPYTSLSRSILKHTKTKVTTVTLKDNETQKTEKRGFKIHLN